MWALVIMLAFVGTVQGQQEIDPTWYDPWATTKKMAVQSPPQHTARVKQSPGSSSVRPDQNGHKVRVKWSAGPRKPVVNVGAH